MSADHRALSAEATVNGCPVSVIALAAARARLEHAALAMAQVLRGKHVVVASPSRHERELVRAAAAFEKAKTKRAQAERDAKGGAS